MTWVRIDDTMPEDPRWDDAGAEALALHVAALAYCNRALSDGRLSLSRARRLLSLADPDAVVARLVNAAFWKLDGDAVLLIDGCADKQPTKADVEQRRADDAARQQLTRERRRRHAAGDHSLCREDYCPEGALSRRDKRSDSQGVSAPSRPDPTRPDPKGGTEGEGTSADAVAPLGSLPASPTSDPRAFRPMHAPTVTWIDNVEGDHDEHEPS